MAQAETAVIRAQEKRPAVYCESRPRTQVFEDAWVSLSEVCDWATLAEQDLEDVVTCIKLPMDGGHVEVHAASGRGVHFRAYGLPNRHWAVLYCRRIRGLRRFQPYGKR